MLSITDRDAFGNPTVGRFAIRERIIEEISHLPGKHQCSFSDRFFNAASGGFCAGRRALQEKLSIRLQEIVNLEFRETRQLPDYEF